MDPKRPPDSKVVHVRGLSSKTTQDDLINLVTRYGKVAYVLLLPQNNQGLIEFETLEGARSLVYKTGPPSRPLTLHGVPCYFNFSTSQYIQRSKKEANINPKILLFTILNAKYPITIETIQKICEPYGKILKIVIFHKNELHALVQFPDDMTAYKVKTNLDGCDIYADCCTLKIEYAKTEDLNVSKNDSMSWDSSKEGLPLPQPMEQHYNVPPAYANTPISTPAPTPIVQDLRLDHSHRSSSSYDTSTISDPYKAAYRRSPTPPPKEPTDADIKAHPYYLRYYEQYYSSTGSESAARAAARAAALAAISMERQEIEDARRKRRREAELAAEQEAIAEKRRQQAAAAASAPPPPMYYGGSQAPSAPLVIHHHQFAPQPPGLSGLPPPLYPTPQPSPAGTPIHMLHPQQPPPSLNLGPLMLAPPAGSILGPPPLGGYAAPPPQNLPPAGMLPPPTHYGAPYGLPPSSSFGGPLHLQPLPPSMIHQSHELNSIQGAHGKSVFDRLGQHQPQQPPSYHPSSSHSSGHSYPGQPSSSSSMERREHYQHHHHPTPSSSSYGPNSSSSGGFRPSSVPPIVTPATLANPPALLDIDPNCVVVASSNQMRPLPPHMMDMSRMPPFGGVGAPGGGPMMRPFHPMMRFGRPPMMSPAQHMAGGPPPNKRARNYEGGGGEEDSSGPGAAGGGTVFVIYGADRTQMNCRMVFNLFSAFGVVIKVKYSNKKQDKLYLEMRDDTSVHKLLSSSLVPQGGGARGSGSNHVLCQIPENNIYCYNSKFNAFNRTYPTFAFVKLGTGEPGDMFNLKIAPIYNTTIKIEDVETRGEEDSKAKMPFNSDENDEGMNDDDDTSFKKVSSSNLSNGNMGSDTLPDGSPGFIADFTRIDITKDVYPVQGLKSSAVNHPNIPTQLLDFVHAQTAPTEALGAGEYAPTRNLLVCNLPPTGISVELVRQLFAWRDAPVPLGVILDVKGGLPNGNDQSANENGKITIVSANIANNSSNKASTKNAIGDTLDKEIAALKDISDSYDVLASQDGQIVKSSCSTVIVEYNTVADAIKAICLANYMIIPYKDPKNPNASPIYFMVKLFFWDGTPTQPKQMMGAPNPGGMTPSHHGGLMGPGGMRPHFINNFHAGGGRMRPPHGFRMPPPHPFNPAAANAGNKGIKRKF